MKKILVSMTERRWIREEASIEMGKTVKYLIVDLDKVVKRIRKEREESNLSPYIDVIPITPDAHKSPNKMPTFQKDPVTGVYYGIANGEDDFGNVRWQRLQLSDNLSLNLDREMECKMWAVLRFNPDIEGSPFQKQYPYYKIYDPVDEAKIEMDEVSKMKVAFELVDTLKKSPMDMVFFARYLGQDLRENSNMNIVEGALLRHAKNHPIDFINKFQSKTRSYAERFHSAVALGIIDQHPDRGYMFRNMSLGLSVEDSIKALSIDNSVMSAINNAIIEKDSVLKIVKSDFLSIAGKVKEQKSSDTKEKGEKLKTDTQKKDKVEPIDTDFE